MIPPLAGRDAPWPCRPLPSCISIHPPLAGRDSIRAPNGAKSRISIHPPLAGRDRRSSAFFRPIADFNPPVPCGAGLMLHMPVRAFIYFNPPAPCGAGQGELNKCSKIGKFQSTRPLWGGTNHMRSAGDKFVFQSTRPLWGGTAILHKKTVQNIAYCTKSAYTLAVLSGFLALMRPFFCQTCTNFGANLPKNRCSLPVRTLIPSGPPPADSRH